MMQKEKLGYAHLCDSCKLLKEIVTLYEDLCADIISTEYEEYQEKKNIIESVKRTRDKVSELSKRIDK